MPTAAGRRGSPISGGRSTPRLGPPFSRLRNRAMEDSRFLRALKDRPILGDGAYGTEFLRRGCPPVRPFDELNLTRPQVVLALHKEYLDAGSELTKTNTFLANGFRLQ